MQPTKISLFLVQNVLQGKLFILRCFNFEIILHNILCTHYVNYFVFRHTLGAAGGLEAVVAARAISDNVVPPTINYETPDPECDLDYVPNEKREMEVTGAMSTNLGFGGHNAAILFKKYTE